MAAVAHHHQPASVPSRSNLNRGIESARGASMSTSANMAPAPAPAPAPASAAKKGKGKKEPDPSESRKLLEAKIAQLEQDQAGDKEQELEIGGSTPALEEVRYWKGQDSILLWRSRKHYSDKATSPAAADMTPHV